MKILSSSLINVIILLTAINHSSPDSIDGLTPYYFLKVTKDNKKKNWKFGYENQDSFYISPTTRLSTNPEKPFKIESFGSLLVVTRPGSDVERFEIQFRFNIDTAAYDKEKRPVINTIDELEASLKKGEWSFNETEKEFVNISYRNGNMLWLNPRKNVTASGNPNFFTVDKVFRVDDPKFGEGLLVKGRFQIVLLEYYGKQEPIRLKKAKFQGFVQIIRK